jgi:hypothetical protein
MPRHSHRRSWSPTPTLTLALLIQVLACAPDRSAPAPVPDSIGAPVTAAGATAAGACDATARPVVDGAGVGPVRVGMAVRDLRARCAATDTTFSLGEGLTETGLVVRLGGAPVVALTTASDSVRRVIVADAGPRTASGVGVGSSVAELRRAYGELCVLIGEGVVVVTTTALPGVSFATSADFRAAAQRGGAHASALADTARVTALWAHAAPAVCDPES